MKTLIICIDRDNDIGEKAGIPSPVLGRDGNLQAAIALGIADPEDSDTNSIFGAIKVYDRLLRGGEDVGIVTVAGDRQVGFESDRRIMQQINVVVKETGAREAIMVTDGAEDESLLGLVQSRINVVGLERITVRQERKIEGLYYFLQKVIEDEKMRKIVVPLAIILMAWGVSMVFGLEGVMKGFIVFLIGTYLLLKTYHLEGDVTRFFKEASQEVKEGKWSWVFSSFSILIFVIGFFRAIDGLRTDPYYTSTHGDSTVFDISFFIYILIIIDHLIWWVLGSLWVRESGRFFDAVVASGEDERPTAVTYWDFLRIVIFLAATAVVFKAGIGIIQFLADPDAMDLNTGNSVGLIVLGITMFFAGREIGTLTAEEHGQPEPGRHRQHRLPRLKRRDRISGWRH